MMQVKQYIKHSYTVNIWKLFIKEGLLPGWRQPHSKGGNKYVQMSEKSKMYPSFYKEQIAGFTWRNFGKIMETSVDSEDSQSVCFAVLI